VIYPVWTKRLTHEVLSAAFLSAIGYLKVRSALQLSGDSDYDGVGPDLDTIQLVSINKTGA
jgi:hypothetical protein